MLQRYIVILQRSIVVLQRPNVILHQTYVMLQQLDVILRSTTFSCTKAYVALQGQEVALLFFGVRVQRRRNNLQEREMCTLLLFLIPYFIIVPLKSVCAVQQNREDKSW